MSSIGIYGRAYSTSKQATKRRPTLPQLMKENAMKRSLKQRIRDWLMNDDLEKNGTALVDEETIHLSRSSSVRFEVHQASGGRVVQTRRYDERKDQNFESLYIVTHDQDFGKEIDKIITMEALR
jgi:hypothetical protein